MLDEDGVREPSGAEMSAEEESQQLFEASRRGKRAKPRPPDGVWGGPHASLWKRLFAAWFRAAGIPIGRFPK